MKRMFARVCVLVCLSLCVLACFGCEKNRNAHTMYEITAEYVPENRSIAGAVKCTFENVTQNELSVLKFQLYPNAYRKNAVYRPVSAACERAAYYNGESYGSIVVSSVNGAKNWEIMGEDENILYVFLEDSLFPGEKVVLDIGFITKLAQVNHRTGVTKKAANFGNFFPILCGIKDGGFYETVYYAEGDPFYFECADYKMTLSLPKEYTLACSGSIEDERMLERKKVYTVYGTNVRDFAFVASDAYRVVSDFVGEKRLSYYYYDDETPRKTLLLLRESFAYYEDTFGQYPYGTFCAAQTGLCFDGMEYSGLVMLSDALTEEQLVRAIARDTAQQWWSVVVGSDQIENAWQDEGLAEYAAVLFLENYEKYGFTREGVVTDALRDYRSYYDVYGSVLGRTDTCMVRHLKEYLSSYEYRCIVYDKSLIMFDTLRKGVGDKKFLEALRRYYKDNKFQMVTSGHLIGSFEKVGLDVSGFFESFLSGKAIL